MNSYLHWEYVCIIVPALLNFVFELVLKFRDADTWSGIMGWGQNVHLTGNS